MRKNATSLAVLLACTLCAARLFALEAKAGLVKIVADESTGRVSLFRLVDVAKDRYEPFVFADDPRTSYVTLSLDGKNYRLGDSAEFRVAASRTESGVRVEFRSAACVVRQDLEFARSEGAALADGIRITFSLENVSQRDASMGLRFLLDTWLAEKSGVHFRTDQRARVVQETSITSADKDVWIATPGPRLELMVLLSGQGLDRPDRALLANWKRLNDEPWSFEANAARNFTLLPYSVNDSALALYWEPALVPRGATRVIRTLLGAFNEKGYPEPSSGPSVSAATEALFAQTVLATPGASRADLLAADLVAVRDLLSRIDRVLASGLPPSAEEVAAWQKILDRLEERKKGY